jgi:hypothetical protein
VAENFALALRYDADPADPRDWESGARDRAPSLRPPGGPRRCMLGRERPMNLDRTERWTVGFVRYLLRPPELLVIDRLFAGLRPAPGRCADRGRIRLITCAIRSGQCSSSTSTATSCPNCPTVEFAITEFAENP